MNWTSTPPTQPGYYWVQYKIPNMKHWYEPDVWRCFIEPTNKVLCYIDLYDDSETIDINDYGDNRTIRFAGPIPHPEFK